MLVEGWTRVADDGIGLISSKSVLRVEVLVDDTAHALLAMVANGLRAVEPEGVLVLDDDGEDLGSLASGSGEVEAGEDGIEHHQEAGTACRNDDWTTV